MTIFRVDFGTDVGMGHLMRSLVFAKRFNDVVYLSKSDKKELVPYELVTIESEEEFFEQVERLKPKQVIVDNYNFTLEDEKEFKKRFPHIKLSVFDDDYREHHCDEIINHNISADTSRYPNPDIVTIIPPLIREEFHKEKAMQREKIYDVFVAMGGTDVANLNIPILKTLPKSFKIALVTTSANAHLQELKNYIAQRQHIHLHIDSKEIAKLMNQSKLAIITPSVILHEVLFIELPFIAIQSAANQHEITNYLKKRGYPLLQKFERTPFLKEFWRQIANRLRLLDFRELSHKERTMVLEWRNDPEIRKWMRNSQPISLKEHLRFITSLQKSDDKRYFVVKEGEEYIGVVDFTDINRNQKSAFFGVYANPASTKRGLGSKLLASLINYAKEELGLRLLRLEVLKSNEKAIALYKKFGFAKYKRETAYIYMELCL